MEKKDGLEGASACQCVSCLARVPFTLSLLGVLPLPRLVSMKTESRKALLWPTPDWNFPWSRRGVDLRKIEIRRKLTDETKALVYYSASAYTYAQTGNSYNNI